MRVLRIELRRSAALWAALLTVVVSLGMFYSLSGPWWKGTSAWTSEWTTLALWQRWLLLETWPLALGIGAWQGRRDARSTMDELAASTPRPAWQRVLPLVSAMALGQITAYLAIFFVGGVQVAFNTDYFPLSWVPVALVGILSTVAAALLGMGVGRAVPSIVTPPAVAALGLAGLILLMGTPDDQSNLHGTVSQAIALLSPNLGTPHAAFSAVTTQVNLLQGIWFLGLGVTGFSLYAATKRKELALLPALAAFAIALPLFPNDRAGVLRTDPEAVALVCADDSPRVCVTRVHQDSLGSIVGPAREALTMLAKIPGAPTAVEEDTTAFNARGPHPRKPGVVLVSFDDWQFASRPRDRILIGPDASCDSWAQTLQVYANRTAVVSWLEGSFRLPYRDQDGTLQPLAESTWNALRALPAAEQPAKVAELRDGSCSG
ncbi:hypothetical protein [Actinocrispum sp. NPDC049592]|uniref:hypothetical protein n=1 Tax=Actinocrispum sp. NPDC049592 TaxID=3154835 RepID=UPI003437884E